MIWIILGGILAVWCLVRRVMPGGKNDGKPLGMPRGTVRAFITILIVSFPLGYLLIGEDVPSFITNSIFVLVAFYFTSRRSGEERLWRSIREIIDPSKVEEAKKEKKPLYLPKYSVRISILMLLGIIVVCNMFGPNCAIEATDTIYDLLTMILLFIAGALFGGILRLFAKKDLETRVKSIPGYESLAVSDIADKLVHEIGKSWVKREGQNLLSTLLMVGVIISLICYTIEWDYVLWIFSLRDGLLLLVNAYYGFRD